MYCAHCGTINPEASESCLKCGRGFKAVAVQTDEGRTPVDVALDARPTGSKVYGSRRGRFSRSLILGLAVGLGMMVSTLMIVRQTGTMRPASLSEKQTVTNSPGSQGGLTGARGAAISPQRALAIAGDAAHKANALRLKTGVIVFAEEHNRFPASIDEIPPSILGFIADPAIYRYWPTQNPEGYHIEVLMESGDVSGANIVTENGVTKYIVNGTWD